MPQYSKQIKSLIRTYADRAYEAELGLALGALEQEFGVWRGGQISAHELSQRIAAFTHGPVRELQQRYSANLDAMQVAHAVATGLLAREELPAALLEALQPTIAFYEGDGRELPEGDAHSDAAT